jgi:uncharacterized OB-fold protein
MSTDTKPRMIATDLVEWSHSGPALVAGRLCADDTVVFPWPWHDESKGKRILLSTHGRLWSFTVQRFQPKSPPYRPNIGKLFKPYVVGYVEFPEGIIVEGRIDARADVDSLRIGQTMITTVVPIFADEFGETIHIFAFRTAEASDMTR